MSVNVAAGLTMYKALAGFVMLGAVVQATIPSVWAGDPQGQKGQGRAPHNMTEEKKISAAQMIGSKLVVGFKGTRPQDPEVQDIAKLAEEGKIGGLIFFAYNIQNPQQVKELTTFFKSLQTPRPLLLAIDQEGGKVQRLKPANGFSQFPSAKEIGEMDPDEAFKAYQAMAQELQDAGFNLVLGPVVDLAYDLDDPEKTVSPAIGKYDRSYGADPETVIRCGAMFIKAMHEKGILTALKHFPGHGLAQKDSHKGFVDITQSHKDRELEPFFALQNQADMVMTAHLTHQGWDKNYPFTLSQKSIKDQFRHQGKDSNVKEQNGKLLISDCLNMGAIAQNYSLYDAVRLALRANVDMVIISNNDGAEINTGKQDDKKPKAKPFNDQIVELTEKLVKNDVNQLNGFLYYDLELSQTRIDGLWHRKTN